MDYRINANTTSLETCFFDFDYSNRDNCGEKYRTLTNGWYNVHSYYVDMREKDGVHNNELVIRQVYNIHWLWCLNEIRQNVTEKQKQEIIDTCWKITEYAYKIFDIEGEINEQRLESIKSYVANVKIDGLEYEYITYPFCIMFLSIIGEKLGNRSGILNLPEQYVQNPPRRFYDAVVNLFNSNNDINTIARNYYLMSEELNDHNDRNDVLWDDQNHESKREIEFTRRKSTHSTTHIGFDWGNKDSWAVHRYKIWKHNNELSFAKKILKDEDYFSNINTYGNYVKPEYLNENNTQNGNIVVYRDFYSIYIQVRDVALRTNGKDNKGDWIDECLEGILQHYQENKRFDIYNTFAVMYLAMLSEYRYNNRNADGTPTLDANNNLIETRTGPKVKMLGVHRILIDGWTERAAENENRGVRPDIIARKCEEVGIEDFLNEH